MKTCFELASVALFDLLIRAVDSAAAGHVAQQQDHDVDAEECVGHRSVLLAGLRDQQHQAVAAQATANEAQNKDEEVHGSIAVDVAVDANKQDHADAGPHDCHDGELEVEHSGLARCTSPHERFESHLAFGEVANGEHELGGNPVIRHLGDATGRDAESICERFGSAALTFEPCLEIHGPSLEQPKRIRQVFSKPRLFILR